jgi:hypothetical protein
MCRAGEAGCCNKVANIQTESMNKASPTASLKYSGQWRRKLSTAFILSSFCIWDAKSKTLSLRDERRGKLL